MLKNKKIIYILLAIFFFGPSHTFAKSVFNKSFGLNEIELELDPYYSDISFYRSLTSKPIPCLMEDNEINIYKDLFQSSYIPKFLLLEASVYPMPDLGVFIKQEYPDFYSSANISKNFNLIRSICAGFEEPAALSLFLGNVVSFKPKGDTDCDGKGYMGYLFSVGKGHIKDSVLIDDDWFEFEWKIKGTKVTKPLHMNWSFRVGTKIHSNHFINDVIYFSVRRTRTDYQLHDLSPLKNIFRNSSIEYTFDVDSHTKNVIRHFFLVGKKYPSKKVVFVLNVGFVWEGIDKYTGPLKREGNEGNLLFLLRPNVEF